MFLYPLHDFVIGGVRINHLMMNNSKEEPLFFKICILQDEPFPNEKHKIKDEQSLRIVVMMTCP